MPYLFFIKVQDYFDNFVKEHPNGKITKQDFGPMMAKVCLSKHYTALSMYELINFQVLPQADAAKMESHVFKVYDANNDGLIDFKEFLVRWHLISL